jgi:hypothetical protein
VPDNRRSSVAPLGVPKVKVVVEPDERT